MSKLGLNHFGLVLILVLLGAVGCDKSSTLQSPLTLEEMPTAFEKAFSKAKPEIKGLADQIIQSVNAKDYPKAFQETQNLAGATGLTKEQASTLGRARLTINELLQSAVATGDEKAATIIENYQRTK